MWDSSTVLIIICLLQLIIGHVSGAEYGPALQLPRRTPGMTNEQYAQAMTNALKAYPGATFSFTGSDGRQISGKVGNPTNSASPRGSASSPPFRPTSAAGLGSGSQSYPPPSSAGSSYSRPPVQNRYPTLGMRGPMPDRRFTSYANPQPASTVPPVENDYSNNGDRQSGKPATDTSLQPNVESARGSPWTGLPSSTRRTPYPLLGNSAQLGSPSTGYLPSPSPPNPGRPATVSGNYPLPGRSQPSPPTVVNNNGDRGNSYGSTPDQPKTSSDDVNEDNPVNSLLANQFGLFQGGGQQGGGQGGQGGSQQQETPSETTPVFDPTDGNDAAAKVAIAIVSGIRSVLKATGTFPGREKPLVEICEKAVANQQPSMKEMKKSDKTLMDVLKTWREKFIDELLILCQNELESNTISRGSRQLNSMVLMISECVRPKLVLMKV